MGNKKFLPRSWRSRDQDNLDKGFAVWEIKRMRHLTGNTPLANYLRKNNLTLEQFSLTLSRDRGSHAGIARLSKWSSGKEPPGSTSIAAIARATNGEVTAKMWERWIASREITQPQKRGW